MVSQNFSVFISDCHKSFSCDDSKSLLHAMFSLGIKGVPIGCRSGGCGVCKVKVTQGKYRVLGKMSRSCISSNDEQQGEVLACRISPESDLTLSVVGKMQQAIIKF